MTEMMNDKAAGEELKDQERFKRALQKVGAHPVMDLSMVEVESLIDLHEILQSAQGEKQVLLKNTVAGAIDKADAEWARLKKRWDEARR